MQAFTLGPRRWRTVRAFGVNPLVRISDRIEAIVVVSAVATSLLAAPVAGAIGTAVHDARSRVYAEEAHTRQPISAIVTTNGHSAAIARPYPTTAVVQARWRAKAWRRAERTLSRERGRRAGGRESHIACAMTSGPSSRRRVGRMRRPSGMPSAALAM